MIIGKKIEMQCEREGCNKKGNDYLRTPKDEIRGWEGEPIYLCDEHAIGYTKFNTLMLHYSRQ